MWNTLHSAWYVWTIKKHNLAYLWSKSGVGYWEDEKREDCREIREEKKVNKTKLFKYSIRETIIFYGVLKTNESLQANVWK